MKEPKHYKYTRFLVYGNNCWASGNTEEEALQNYSERSGTREIEGKLLLGSEEPFLFDKAWVYVNDVGEVVTRNCKIIGEK